MKRFIATLAIVALMGSPAFAKKSMGMMPTCKSGDPVVWMNTKSKVMHMKGDPHYGTTKAGMYACQSDAMAKGAHMSGQKMSGGAMSGGAMSGDSTTGMKKKHHKKTGDMMASPAPAAT